MTALAIVLIVAGVGIAVRGIRRQTAGLRLPPTDPRLGYALVRAGRSVLTGLAIAGAGVGVAAGLPWVVGLALAIGAEELLETSVVIAALDAAERGVPVRAAR